MDQPSPGTPTALSVGMVIFPGMTNLDFVGPHEVFARMPGATVHVLAAADAPVVTDLGLRVLPTATLDSAPPLDLLFVGGGPGTTALMEDARVVGFLRDRAPGARWVTSVCTGALVLGAAGLLRGYRAATHWAAMEALRPFGAEPVHERVVVDRNRVTGGGVTAGLDFGLSIANILHGPEVTQALQLGMEYDPAPPFRSGSPATAPAAVVERVRGAMAGMTGRRMEVAERVAAANGWTGAAGPAAGRRAVVGAAFALPFLARAAAAQPVPRTARILVGFPPGGSVDVVARLLAERLRGTYAANVVVENRAGAAGRLAVEELRRAEADGTTALLTPASMVTIFPTLYAGRLRYDVAADLAPVTPVCLYPFGLAVGPGAPGAADVAGLAALARSRGELPYASPAAGSIPHFLGVEFAKAAGIRLTHVPYRGAAPALQDAMAGQIPAVVNVLGDLVPHHEAGRLRVLAVSSPARAPKLPDVPTFAEAGLPRLTADEWYGLFLPARSPPATVAALNAGAGAAGSEPGMVAALDRQAFAPFHLSPADYAARIRAETAHWAPIVTESGFRPEE